MAFLDSFLRFFRLLVSMVLERVFAFDVPWSFLGFLAGLKLAGSWYKWSYTIKHPFLSALFGYFLTAFFCSYFTGKPGMVKFVVSVLSFSVYNFLISTD